MRRSSEKTKKQQCCVSFVGKYEVTVLSDERIILPAVVIRQLKAHGIERVFLGKLPGLRALVLCPENHWGHWIKKLKNSFPCLMNHDGARTFLIPWQPVHLDSKGRITLPRRARDYAGIKANDTAIIVGTNYCFELWSEKNFNDKVRECEATLRKSVQPTLPIEKVFYPAKDRK